ncbi:MAG: CBS domain-containing protein [Candidatus Micrarchaeota archaeon]|nr:CBS domain-containing protein [Candidatus Micrarchaeota archaeon]
MKVSEIMKKKFLVLEADETVASALKKLVESGQSAAPVVRQRKFVGMLLTSDIAALFVKVGIFGVSAADPQTMSCDVVSKHIRNKKTWLYEEADLISAFGLLVHQNVEVIPVIDKNKQVVGIVDVADLRKEMSKVLSGGKDMPVRTPEKTEELEMSGGKTAIDSIVHYVQQKKAASAEEVAKSCGLTLQEVEEYAASLEKNGLLRTEYNIFGKMKLYAPE